MWKEVPRTRKKEVQSSHHVESLRPSLKTVSLLSAIHSVIDINNNIVYNLKSIVQINNSVIDINNNKHSRLLM